MYAFFFSFIFILFFCNDRRIEVLRETNKEEGKIRELKKELWTSREDKWFRFLGGGVHTHFFRPKTLKGIIQ